MRTTVPVMIGLNSAPAIPIKTIADWAANASRASAITVYPAA